MPDSPLPPLYGEHFPEELRQYLTAAQTLPPDTRTEAERKLELRLALFAPRWWHYPHKPEAA